METKALLSKPLPVIPPEISDALLRNEITGTSFESKNDILTNASLHCEAGYKKMEDGSYLVSMFCPMPKIHPDMIRWWFWWHPGKSDRYQIWFPGAHLSIGYPGHQAHYFERDTCPEFQNNTQYPHEKIGKTSLPLRIDFVSPEEFGFSKPVMESNNIPLIVCGHVGALKGLIWHTEMAHIFKETEDGLFMISRFWMGKSLKNPLLRKAILTDDMAKSMAEHCCVEYRNLLEILPELYSEHHLRHN